MKASRIVSWLTEEALIRPIFPVAIAVLLLDIIYVNLFYKYPGQSDYGAKTATISGVVREKTSDEQGGLKSIIVGNTICYVNKCDNTYDCVFGARLKLKGRLDSIAAPMNKGEFDMRAYYASEHVYYVMYADSVEVISKPRISIKEKVYRLRQKWVSMVRSACPYEGGTINTLLVAEKSGLDSDRKEVYQRVGVAHFLVISGLHVSAIGLAVFSLLSTLGVTRKPACVVSIIFLFSYGYIVGFSVSVKRAIVMFVIRLMADIVRQIYDMLCAVSFALIFSVISNPVGVLNPAFAYSYMTVFTIAIYVTYIHPKAYRRLGIRGILREALRIPAVLFIFMLPVNLRFSYSANLLSVLINAVLAPMSGLILLLAFFAFVFSICKVAALAKVVDVLLAILLTVFDRVCAGAGKLSVFEICGKITGWQMAMYYCLLLAFFAFFKETMSKSARIMYFSLLIFISGACILEKPSISMLYVGQGECVVLRTGTRSAVVVDCGSTSEREIVKYTVGPFLKASGITRIHNIFVTHSDMDHCGEVVNLIDFCKKNGIFVLQADLPDLPKEFRDELYIRTLEGMLDEGIKAAYVKKGSHFLRGWLELYVLWPDMKSLSGDANADSVVMLVKRGSFDALLTGDATMETEERICGTAKKLITGRLDVLKVSHHGSKTGTSEKMLSVLLPKEAIISAGINNRYGHPHEDVLRKLREYGVKIKRTGEAGEIRITP